jgi:hypothetical protein
MIAARLPDIAAVTLLLREERFRSGMLSAFRFVAGTFDCVAAR